MHKLIFFLQVGGKTNKENNMKWLTIAVCLMFSQLQAQNLKLSLVENSVSVIKDSLHFKYKFQNTSNLTLTIYNAHFGNIDMFGIDTINNFKNNSLKITPLPRLLIDIYNSKNELPKLTFLPTNHKISDNIYNADKYIILKPNESREYKFSQSISQRGLLKGEYKLQLVYFSNSYYKYKFLNAKKKDNRLKNSILFTGVIKSNMVKFNYFPTQTDHH